MPAWRKDQVALARRFLADYAGLARRTCSAQEWLQLKFSCSRLRAARLMARITAEDAAGARPS